MAGAKQLIAAIGAKNLGLVLDSWHWYTAHETAADLETLTNDQIVAVDLNDAPVRAEPFSAALRVMPPEEALAATAAAMNRAFALVR